MVFVAPRSNKRDGRSTRFERSRAPHACSVAVLRDQHASRRWGSEVLNRLHRVLAAKPKWYTRR